MSNLALVRRLWQLIEPVHAILYYAPEVSATVGELGYDVSTRWPSYFALRGAPLGVAGPRTIGSAFYSFSPAMVTQHVPAAWRVATPGAVLEARTRGVDAALRALLGSAVAAADLAEAAALARRAAEAASTTGRPLGAANADLPWPDEPHLILWHAATILREQRGDGHIAALLTNGLDPIEAAGLVRRRRRGSGVGVREPGLVRRRMVHRRRAAAFARAGGRRRAGHRGRPGGARGGGTHHRSARRVTLGRPRPGRRTLRRADRADHPAHRRLRSPANPEHARDPTHLSRRPLWTVHCGPSTVDAARVKVSASCRT